MKQRLKKLWLLIVLPLAFLLKDLIATMAVLSTEPGITSKAVLFYGIALLPGSLFLGTSQYTLLFNLLFGALLGVVFYVRAIRQKDAVSHS